MKLNTDICDRIAEKINEKFNDNNWNMHQNFSFDLEIEDKDNNNWLYIDVHMNLILYFSKTDGRLNNVVPIWWDIKVAKWNDEKEEWDNNIECDIEWSEIGDRLVEMR